MSNEITNKKAVCEHCGCKYKAGRFTNFYHVGGLILCHNCRNRFILYAIGQAFGVDVIYDARWY